jgi:hypothetical protein
MSNQNNRALGRIGARLLTPQEEAMVIGGVGRGTATLCSAPNSQRPADGDPGEC